MGYMTVNRDPESLIESFIELMINSCCKFFIVVPVVTHFRRADGLAIGNL